MKILDCQPGQYVTTKDYHGRIEWMDRGPGRGIVIVKFTDDTGGQIRKYPCRSEAQVH